jgi:hypothetical protein
MASLLLEAYAAAHTPQGPKAIRITPYDVAAAVFELGEMQELSIRYSSQGKVTLMPQLTPVDNLDRVQHLLRRSIFPPRNAGEVTIETSTGAKSRFHCIPQINSAIRDINPRRQRRAGAARDSVISLLLWSHGNQSDHQLRHEINAWVRNNSQPRWWAPREKESWGLTSADHLFQTYKALVGAFD